MRTVSESSRLWDDRRHLFTALMQQNEGRPLRVTRQNLQGRPQKWVSVGEYMPHSYRTVLPTEVVFDIDTDDWYECVRQTHALWTVLNFRQVQYWGALSGGKGTHTHVFVENEQDRRALVNDIVVDVNDLISDDIVVDGVKFKYETDRFDADPRLLAPNEGSRVVREFGVTKNYAKTLWTIGPQGFFPIPINRTHAYRVAGMRVPTEIPRVYETVYDVSANGNGANGFSDGFSRTTSKEE